MIYLGYCINENGYNAPKDKIKCINEYPKPKTIKDLRVFLGMLNYYRRSLKNIAEI